jgi:hypothetical protein
MNSSIPGMRVLSSAVFASVQNVAVNIGKYMYTPPVNTLMIFRGIRFGDSKTGNRVDGLIPDITMKRGFEVRVVGEAKSRDLMTAKFSDMEKSVAAELKAQAADLFPSQV